MKTDLPTRLEGAAAGSRELDAEVWACVTGYELFEHDGAGWRYRMKSDDIMRHRRTGHIEPVTTSIDAAVALAERVLGEAARWECGWNSFEKAWATAYSPTTFLGHSSRSQTPALALCAAILRAKGDAS